MYVCVCRAVTDKEVEAAIDAGATTVAAVTAACEAGGDCGACRGMIDDMIDERHRPVAFGAGTAGCCSKRRLEVVRAA